MPFARCPGSVTDCFNVPSVLRSSLLLRDNLVAPLDTVVKDTGDALNRLHNAVCGVCALFIIIVWRCRCGWVSAELAASMLVSAESQARVQVNTFFTHGGSNTWTGRAFARAGGYSTNTNYVTVRCEAGVCHILPPR